MRLLLISLFMFLISLSVFASGETSDMGNLLLQILGGIAVVLVIGVVYLIVVVIRTLSYLKKKEQK